MIVKDKMLINISDDDIVDSKVIIPEGIMEIGPYAFKGNYKIQEVVLPKDLTKISEGAFCECYELKQITLPNNLAEISNYAFINCCSLFEITLPENLKMIGTGAFSNCTALKDVHFKNIDVKIDNEAFLNTPYEHENGHDNLQSDGLARFENFFAIDTDIKRKLYSASLFPDIGDDNLIEYTDKLWKTSGNIEKQLISICNLFDLGTSIIKTIQEKINECRLKIAYTDYTYPDLSKIYNDYFAKMSEENIYDIHKTFVGNTGMSSFQLYSFLQKSSSINEMLHAIHSYVVNNERILGNVPLISSYNINNGYDDTINLRGSTNDLTKQIYNTLIQQSELLPYEYRRAIGIGTTDIIAINKSKKIIMMVRDIGHSLTIEAKEEKNEQIGVEYFVPKVIDANLVRQLPGINNFNDGDYFATGSFITSKKEFCNDIIRLVNSVPTDAHIHLSGSDTSDTNYPTSQQYFESKTKVNK